MGATDEHLELMVRLCKDPNPEIVRNAALALSLAAYCEDNVDRMGRMEGCISTLMDLCTKQEDKVIHAQALVAIANLGYAHPRNQARCVLMQ